MITPSSNVQPSLAKPKPLMKLAPNSRGTYAAQTRKATATSARSAGTTTTQPKANDTLAFSPVNSLASSENKIAQLQKLLNETTEALEHIRTLVDTELVTKKPRRHPSCISEDTFFGVISDIKNGINPYITCGEYGISLCTYRRITQGEHALNTHLNVFPPFA